MIRKNFKKIVLPFFFVLFSMQVFGDSSGPSREESLLCGTRIGSILNGGSRKKIMEVHGVMLDLTDPIGEKIVEAMEAIDANDLVLLKKIIELDSKIKNNKDLLGGLMAIAGGRNFLEIVEELINFGADLESKAFCGETPLITAILLKNAAWVRILVHRGANPNVKTKDRMSALFCAVLSKDKAVIAELLKAKDLNINAVDDRGVTAIMLATHEGLHEIAEMLMGDFSDGGWSEKLLEIMDADDLPRLLEFLEQNPEAKNNPHCLASFMTFAGKRNRMEMVRELIKLGADVNSKFYYGEFPLVVAVAQGNFDWVKILLSSGANPNTKNKIGAPVLFHAVCKKRLDIVVELLKTKGIRVNELTTEGHTALSVAVLKELEDIGEALLEAGAKLSDKDWKLFPQNDGSVDEQGKIETQQKKPGLLSSVGDFMDCYAIPLTLVACTVIGIVAVFLPDRSSPRIYRTDF